MIRIRFQDLRKKWDKIQNTRYNTSSVPKEINLEMSRRLII